MCGSKSAANRQVKSKQAYLKGLSLSLKIERYLEEFSRICSVSSPAGRQCDLLQWGMVEVQWGRKNGSESRLLRLIDMCPELSGLTARDLEVLMVYHYGNGGVYYDFSTDHQVVDQWRSGVSHQQAAKLLGITGRGAAKRAKDAYLKVLKKLALV